MTTEYDRQFMLRAIEMARIGMYSNSGGPFVAVVVKNGVVVGEGSNQVTSSKIRPPTLKSWRFEALAPNYEHFNWTAL